MKVVRYTFDVCFSKRVGKDVYSMASELEKAIMKVGGICGCEVKDTHTFRIHGVDVDKVMEIQERTGKTIEEERR